MPGTAIVPGRQTEGVHVRLLQDIIAAEYPKISILYAEVGWAPIALDPRGIAGASLCTDLLGGSIRREFVPYSHE